MEGVVRHGSAGAEWRGQEREARSGMACWAWPDGAAGLARRGQERGESDGLARQEWHGWRGLVWARSGRQQTKQTREIEMVATKQNEVVDIKAANIVRATLKIKGTAPLVQNKFSKKAREQMMLSMSTPKNQKKAKGDRPPRDYDTEFKQAQHRATEGWPGIPCASFRAAMIDACRTIGIVMTRTKMAVFVVPDGFDKEDGTPLVKIKADDPERREDLVRNDSGVADVRIRPMWREWECDVTLDFDLDMITASAVANLLDRAGRQVGVGEGRPFSKNSVGQGWGTFQVVQE